MAIEICDVGDELAEKELMPANSSRVAESPEELLEKVAGRKGIGGDVRIGRSGSHLFARLGL